MVQDVLFRKLPSRIPLASASQQSAMCQASDHAPEVQMQWRPDPALPWVACVWVPLRKYSVI